jgi:hypothetical protein
VKRVAARLETGRRIGDAIVASVIDHARAAARLVLVVLAFTFRRMRVISR